jgi:gamma-glutamylcyclotransferase (GGCT)/AIG2-like uncharacterized protein YtfP
METVSNLVPDLVPVFVYGTLRPSFNRASWLDSITVDTAQGFVTGFSLYKQDSLDYPFAVVSDNETDTVQGDLVVVKYGQELVDLIEMEIAAGYVLREVPVWGKDVDPEETPITALMFIQETVSESAKLIESGDFASVVSGDTQDLT